MHVRGSSLSQPRVQEALRPFIVSFWGQSEDEFIPADVQPLYDASGFGSSNVRCFIIDSEGKLQHSFSGFPGFSGNPTAYSSEQYAEYFAGEILKGAARLELPKTPVPAPVLKLPEVKDGVRLFIRLPGRRDSYGYPVVETVENKAEWRVLSYPKSTRSIEARQLSRWLGRCYPAGVNEQLEPFKFFRGTLKLQPIGPKQAILTGKVWLALTETGHELFEGTLDALLTYAPATGVSPVTTSPAAPMLQGVVDGIYWRQDLRQNRWMDWKLTMAIESLPIGKESRPH